MNVDCRQGEFKISLILRSYSPIFALDTIDTRGSFSYQKTDKRQAHLFWLCILFVHRAMRQFFLSQQPLLQPSPTKWTALSLLLTSQTLLVQGRQN